MTFDPLLSASFAIKLHVATVVPAAVLGAYILASRKGDRLHCIMGRVWLTLMVLSALSSFFIHEIRTWGDFSPIHLLSIWVLIASVLIIKTAREGNLKAHRGYVTGTYLGGIVGAGLFTLLPGRIFNRVLMGGYAFDGLPQLSALAPVILVVALFFFAGRLAWKAR